MSETSSNHRTITAGGHRFGPDLQCTGGDVSGFIRCPQTWAMQQETPTECEAYLPKGGNRYPRGGSRPDLRWLGELCKASGLQYMQIAEEADCSVTMVSTTFRKQYGASLDLASRIELIARSRLAAMGVHVGEG